VSKSVYSFGNGAAEGTRDMKEILGGKGANLAEMTNLGVPVPPGFTIACDVCIRYLEDGSSPDGLRDEVHQHLARLEETSGKRFGDIGRPLLVSVRSGAPVSMPGMMETILNLGLNASRKRAASPTSSRSSATITSGARSSSRRRRAAWQKCASSSARCARCSTVNVS